MDDWENLEKEMLEFLKTPEFEKMCEDLEVSREPSKKGWVTGKVCDWFEVPFDIRRLIIEAMDDDTKMAFLLCSDECAADMPKNYIKRIDTYGNSLGVDVISSGDFLYTLNFKESNEKCIITPHSGLYWEMEEEGSIADVISKYFHRIFSNFPYLEEFQIQRSDVRVDNITVNHLTKLNRLMVVQNSEVDLFECGFITFDKFCNLSVSISIECMPLSLSQLKQVKAASISYEWKNVSSKYVNDYLKCFVNGEIHQNVKKVFLHTNKSRFYIEELTDGLEVFEEENNDDKFSFSVYSTVNTNIVAVVDTHTRYIVINVYTKEELEEKKNNPEPVDMDEFYGW